MAFVKISREQVAPNVTKTVYQGTREDQIAHLEELKAKAGNAETLQYFDRVLKEVKRMGRKPKSAEKLRSLKCTARFNREEFELISQALDEDTEFAAGLRELALEAARLRLLEKEGTQNDG